ncbi:hypothetical protein ACTFIY_009454 [Dictyostelium cf. discoideum]
MEHLEHLTKTAAQKLWMINQFIHASETKSIVASHHKSWEHQFMKNRFTSKFLKTNLEYWNNIRINKSIYTQTPKSIKNNNNQPLSLTEWYNEIHKTDNTIPKTEFQQSLNLRGYSYEKLFENVLKIKDPKTKDTMFRFHARCLPLNYLHKKGCTLCNENLGKDPYGHLFFKCKETLEFIQPHKLKNFIYIATGRGKHWTHERTRSNNFTINKNQTYNPSKHEERS